MQALPEIAIIIAIAALVLAILFFQVYNAPGGLRDLRRARARLCAVLAEASEESLDIYTLQTRSGLGAVSVVNGIADLVTCGIVRMHTQRAPGGAIVSRHYSLVKREREARLARGRRLRANAE